MNIKKYITGTFLLLLAACEHTVFAEPEIVYKNTDSIEVKYLNAGIKTSHNEKAAIEIIQTHCNGEFEIKSRHTSGKSTFISAKCKSI